MSSSRFRCLIAGAAAVVLLLGPLAQGALRAQTPSPSQINVQLTSRPPDPQTGWHYEAPVRGASLTPPTPLFSPAQVQIPPKPPAPAAQLTSVSAKAPGGMDSPHRESLGKAPDSAGVLSTVSNYALAFPDGRMFRPNTAVTLPITLTNNGAPVSGALVEIGWDGQLSKLTDDTGTATVTFDTPPYREFLPVRATVNGLWAAESNIYVVPDGHGVIEVAPFTLPDGSPANLYNAGFYYPDTYGTNWWTMGNWPVLPGAVMPVGTNYVEVMGRNGDQTAAAYHYQTVTVTDMTLETVTVPTNTLVPVQASLAVDGQPVPVGLLLHNQALPDRSGAYYEWSLPADNTWATPGMYTMLLKSEDPTGGALVQTANVSVPAAGPVALELASTSLGLLTLAGGGPTGNPIDFKTGLLVGPFSTHIIGSNNFLITPGVQVTPQWYSVTMEGSDNLPWDYSFQSERDPITVAAGAQATIGLGGAISPQVIPEPNTCLQPGCTAWFNQKLQAPEGDWLDRITQDHQEVSGTLALKTLAGEVVTSTKILPRDWHASLTVPADTPPGDYQVQASYDLGPYQGVVERTVPVTVTTPPPDFSLSIENDLFAAGAPVQTTLTLRNHGNPESGATLSLGHQGEFGPFTTGGDGTVVVSFTAPAESTAIPINVVQGTNRFYVGDLFVLEAAHGLVLVEHPLWPDNTPVDYFSANILNGWTASWWKGAPRFIAPAGANHLEIASPSGDGLYLYLPITVPAGQKMTVTPTATGTVRLTAAATLDGTDTGGDLALHNEAVPSPTPAWLGWLPPNPWVTPGTYTMAIRSETTPALIMGTQIDVSADRSVTLSATSSEVATLNLQMSDEAGGLLPAEVLLELPNLSVWLATGQYKILPDFSYRSTLASFSLPDTNGEDFWYTLYRRAPSAPVTPVAGGQVNFPFGGPVSADLTQWNVCNGPGCTVTFRTGLNTALDRVVPHYRPGDSRGTLTVTDSLGNTVISRDADPSKDWESITFPAGVEDIFTVNLSYETGPYAGTVQTSKTIAVLNLSAYSVSLSQEILPADTNGVTVIATVTKDGVPAPNIALEIGYYGQYGTVSTNAAGQATITLDTYYREIVPLYFAGNYHPVGKLFVVPAGDGVLTVEPTDLAGKPLVGYTAEFTALGESSGLSTWTKLSATGAVSAIQPAGTNHVEIFGINPDDGKGLFLYHSVNLTAGVHTRLTLNGANTVPFGVNAKVDGVAVTGQMALRNEAFPSWTWIQDVRTVPTDSYVTAGTYTVAFLAENRRLLLLRSGVDTIASPTLTLNETSSGLSQLNLVGLNGHGAPVPVRTFLELPGWLLPVDTGGDPWYVTPDISYRLMWGNHWAFVGQDTWNYGVGNAGPTAVPATGETKTLTWGGPVTGHLVPEAPCGTQACTVIVQTFLQTASGQRFYGDSTTNQAKMRAVLKNSDGTIVWNTEAPAVTKQLAVPVPDVLQVYKLEVTWSIGPYQDPVTAVKALSGATIEGSVEAEARPAGYPATVKLIDAQNHTVTAPVAQDGSFTLDGVLDGQYVLRAEAPGHKAVEVAVTVSGGQVTVPADYITVMLPFGDLNDDGVIGNTDIVIIMGHYNESGSATDMAFAMMDVNGDGRIDLHDLVWLFRNTSP